MKLCIRWMGILSLGFTLGACSHVSYTKTCSAPYAQKGTEKLQACEEDASRAPSSYGSTRTRSDDDVMRRLPLKAR